MIFSKSWTCNACLEKLLRGDDRVLRQRRRSYGSPTKIEKQIYEDKKELSTRQKVYNFRVKDGPLNDRGFYYKYPVVGWVYSITSLDAERC